MVVYVTYSHQHTIMSHGKISLQFLPKDLRVSLMKFQKRGIRFAIDKHGRCLFGDEMGLGKTLQAISTAYYYKSEWPLLIICPASIKFSWVNELEKWLPELQPGDINLVSSFSSLTTVVTSKITIISYGLLSLQKRNTSEKSLTKVISKTKFGVLILDESHYIRNRKSLRTKEVLSIAKNIQHVLLLSGTPSLAKPEELYPQLNVLAPRTFNNFNKFAQRFCDAHYETDRGRNGTTYNKYVTSGASNLEELHNLLKQHVMIRRLKKQVLTELPPKRRQKILFQISEDSCYKQTVARHYNTLKSLRDNADEMMTSFDYNSCFIDLFNATALAKAGAVKQYISDLIDGMENKFVVFCFHLSMIQAIRQTLVQKNIKFICITGESHSVQRGIDVKKFQDDKTFRVALLTIQTASVGLTLTAADHVVFAELHFTPGVLIQAEDRCHRIGQLNSVQIHYLIAMGTVDSVLWSRLQRKIVVTSTALNGKVINDLEAEEDHDRHDILSHVDAWIPIPMQHEDLSQSLLFQTHESRLEENDIKSYFDGSKKRKKKISKPQNQSSSYVIDDDEDFKNPSKRRKKIPKTDFVDLLSPEKIVEDIKLIIIPKPSSLIDVGGSSNSNTESKNKFSVLQNINGAMQILLNTEEKNVSENICIPKIENSKESVLFYFQQETIRNSLSNHQPFFEQAKSSCNKLVTCDSHVPHDIENHSSIVPFSKTLKENMNVHEIKKKSEKLKFGNHSKYTDDNISNQTNSPVVNIADSRNKTLGFDTMKLVDNDVWECSLCTFQNHPLLSFCEMCESKRGAKIHSNIQDMEIVSENVKSDVDLNTIPKDNIAENNAESSENLFNHVICETPPPPDRNSDIEDFSSDASDNEIKIAKNNICIKNDEKITDFTEPSKFDKPCERKEISRNLNNDGFDYFGDSDDSIDGIFQNEAECSSQNESESVREADSSTVNSSRNSDPNISCDSILTSKVGNESMETEEDFERRTSSQENKNEISFGDDELFGDELDSLLLNISEKQLSQQSLYSDTSDDESDDVIDNNNDVRTMKLMFRLSSYTERVYVYEKETNKYLHMYFDIQDIIMNQFENLPPLLRHLENLLQIKQFVFKWRRLGPRKQSLIKKYKDAYCDPDVVYKIVCQQANEKRKESMQRYTSQEKDKKHMENLAAQIGGKVVTKNYKRKKKDTDTNQAGPSKQNNVKQVNQVVDKNKIPLCLFCSRQVIGVNAGSVEARFCSEQCMKDYKVRRKNTHHGARELLFDLERGVCQLCGYDTHALCERLRNATPEQRKKILKETPFMKLPVKILNSMIKNPKSGLFWHADHINPVVEGGGECGLENLRTLCVPCHDDVTRQLRKRLKEKKSANNKSIVDMLLKETKP